MEKMIAENVIFVDDESGHDYYIPVEKEKRWNEWIGGDDWGMGNVPDYATLVEGEDYVFHVVRVKDEKS